MMKMVFKAIAILALAAVIVAAVGLAFLRFWPSVGRGPDRDERAELMIAECGQYDSAWAKIHMTPEQTVQAAADVGADWLIPVHWGSFCICNHAWDDSIRRVTAAAQTAGIRLAAPEIGRTADYDALSDCANSWWEAYE